VNGAKEPGSFRLVATLALTGLLSGLVLVGIYLVTQPRILRNQAEALYAAIYGVLPGTEEIRTFVVREGRLVAYESQDGKLPDEQAVYAGHRQDGSLVGYAVPAAGAGFQDTIKLIYGYDPSRRVIVGMQVLDSRETPGLGDKIITDDEFLANFEALAIEPSIVAVKHGKKTNPNEVDSITGATISSEAVVKILNESSQQWAPMLSPQDETSEVSRNVSRAEP
jgi:Na+-translocating ferredoxin:NAD+ oxidoreductase subunit G